MSVLQSTFTLRLHYQQFTVIVNCELCFPMWNIVTCILWYGFCNGNSRAAVDEYQRHFPDRRIPSRGVFSRIHQTMRETGCLPSDAVHSERKVVPLTNTWENILEMVQRSPQLSTRRIASRISTSHMQVWWTLHEEDLHPYHDHGVQHLEPGDPAQCMDFCHWITTHPQLLSAILFTDEASFTHDGINNSRNVHTWSHDNPHETSVTKFQRRFSVNVWCGLLGNKLIRPFVFDNNLTGNTYKGFLRNELPGLLKDIPLMIRSQMYFQRDGAPPHYIWHVTEYLNEYFPNCWLGHGGPLARPPRLPDLTTLDYYLWGHMKILVYETKVDSRAALHHHNFAATEHIHNHPDNNASATQSLLMRAENCTSTGGGHFEQLL